MNFTLHPESLKAARKNRGWSQRELAEESNLSIEQISRWERSPQKTKPRSSSRKRLTEALRVSWEELSKAPSHQGEEESKILPTEQLHYRIKSSVKNALVLASRRYNIKEVDIIELAPLLFLIAAEKSLAEREVNIDAIEEQFEETFNNSRRYAPILAATFYRDRSKFKKAIDQERHLIKNKKVFEILHHAPFDLHHDFFMAPEFEGESVEPFWNYLGRLIDGLPQDISDEVLAKTVSDEDKANVLSEAEKRLAEERVGTRYLSYPEYRIAANTLKEITGITGEQEIDPELFDLIAEGYINLKSVIKQKQNSSPDDYRDWLQKKYRETKSIRDLGEEELQKEMSDLF